MFDYFAKTHESVEDYIYRNDEYRTVDIHYFSMLEFRSGTDGEKASRGASEMLKIVDD